jgi:alpha-amylase
MRKTAKSRLVLGFHNHQPVGNFDGVILQNYEQAYRPLIEVFREFPAIKFCMHISGPLWTWLEQNRSGYFDVLAELIDRGQLELLAGAWSEPILPMIPRRDRIGQIQYFAELIQKRFGNRPAGMWLAERVWEPGLVESIVRGGISYTVLDDFHFQRAGLSPKSLNGYFLTEDEGHLLRLFPNSEPLRYLVPWREPEAAIEYLLKEAEAEADVLHVTADDGEKFGGWPGTHELIYEKKWLEQFLTRLSEESETIQTSTFAEIIHEMPPAGKIWLPPASYREMTEWVLPTEIQAEYEIAKCNLEKADTEFSKPIARFFAPGGFWRNFQAKYAESAEMADHMKALSQIVARVENALKVKMQSGADASNQMQSLEKARLHLYNAQCNCAYWHGAFGGLYLPHLRNAIYQNLIAAENAIDEILAPSGNYLRVIESDFNADTFNEIRIDNRFLIAWISPENGGQIYEFDDRRTCTNLLATLNRRPEPYHQKVVHAAQKPVEEASEGPSNLHDRIQLKHDGLDRLMVYDHYPRKALVDHLWPEGIAFDSVKAGRAAELTDWPSVTYQLLKIEKNENAVEVCLARDRSAENNNLISIEKRIKILRNEAALHFKYRLTGLAGQPKMQFAVEINIAGMAGHEFDRQFKDHDQNSLGMLDSELQIHKPSSLMLTDGWLDLATRIDWEENPPEKLWTMPIQTVSNSEGGFEAIFQSTAIFALWTVGGDAADDIEVNFIWQLCPSHEGCGM